VFARVLACVGGFGRGAKNAATNRATTRLKNKKSQVDTG
jgi:hypothetical protein